MSLPTLQRQRPQWVLWQLSPLWVKSHQTSVIGFRVRVKDNNHDKDRHGGHDEDDEDHDDERSCREA